MKNKQTTILGIETSCDETAVAIVNAHKDILANCVFSQYEDHKQFGGVVPEIAARAHLQKLPLMIQEALDQAHLSFTQIDAIAATTGPGLIGGVLVGMCLGKALAFGLQKPFLPINHLAGHALAVRLTEDVDFPYLLLLVSGGHSQFVIVNSPYDYIELGATRDDAVGETFDKTAKLLGLPYPGGPALEKLAKQGNSKVFTFPKPLYKSPTCDLSLSGLKTAVRIAIQKQEPLTEQKKADIAASFQETICELLVDRLRVALQAALTLNSNIHTVVVSGGVAANQTLRSSLNRLFQDEKIHCVFPPINLCTDNAAMIAWAGIEMMDKYKQKRYDAQARPRWPLKELGI